MMKSNKEHALSPSWDKHSPRDYENLQFFSLYKADKARQAAVGSICLEEAEKARQKKIEKMHQKEAEKAHEKETSVDSMNEEMFFKMD